MIGLLQRVKRAHVEVDGEIIASIGVGLLVLVGVERDDALGNAERLTDRLLRYRVFHDEAGRMNRPLTDCGNACAGLLLVPQFTLAADTRNGNRAGFATAAAPAVASELFASLVEACSRQWPYVCAGIFGAHMQVSLVNDGPVTFHLSA